MNPVKPKYHTLVLLISLLTACNATSLSNNLNPQGQLNSKQISVRTQEQLWKTFKSKPPYSTAPTISINTGLLNPNKALSRKIDVSPLMKSTQFQVKGVPQGSAVFQENFVKSSTEFDETFGFKAPDPSKRYTLYIHKTGNTSLSGKVEVNINGVDWISARDFSESTQEKEVKSLILNANNSIRIRLYGQEGVSFEVLVVEGGSAGTVLRRRGDVGLYEETHATRVQGNDKNIFDPSDPSSLGGLQPYDGHLEEPNSPPGVTGVSVDSAPPIQFEAGVLILGLRDPETIVPLLESKYGAVILDKQKVPGENNFEFHLVQFDLEKSPIALASELIQSYREKIPAAFNSFEFASVSGFKTFVILLDLLENHEEFVANWELNLYSKAPLDSVLTNDWNQRASIYPIGNNNSGWWLRDTLTLEAWNYSVGTGVNVAYIDRGFENIKNGATSHGELGRRLKTNYSSGNQNTIVVRRPNEVRQNPNNNLECLPINPTSSAKDFCRRTHGIFTATAGFGERDNNEGTVGIAPNANLIPFNTDGFSYTYALALGHIVGDLQDGKKYDVIGFNNNFPAPVGWKPTTQLLPEPGNDDASKTFLRLMFHNVISRGVPIIVPAGNNGSRCGQTGPDASGKCVNGEFVANTVPQSFKGETSIYNSGQKVNFFIAGGATRDNSKPKRLVPSTNLVPFNASASGEIRPVAMSFLV